MGEWGRIRGRWGQGRAARGLWFPEAGFSGAGFSGAGFSWVRRFLWRRSRGLRWRTRRCGAQGTIFHAFGIDDDVGGIGLEGSESDVGGGGAQGAEE